MFRVLCSAFVVAAIGLVTVRASAQPKQPDADKGVSDNGVPLQQTVAADLDRQARMHFETATALFESGEYERAADEFEEAYRLSNRPQLLFNISLAYERLGKLEQAIELLRAYLVAVPETPKRGRLELRIQRMQERLDQQRANEPSAVAIAPVASEPEKQPEVVPFNWLAPSVVTTASITLAGGLALAIFGPLALKEKAKQEDRCAPDCSDSELKQLRTYRLTADIGLGVAVAGVIAAAIWIPLDVRAARNPQERAQGGGPSIGVGLASANLRWSY